MKTALLVNVVLIAWNVIECVLFQHWWSIVAACLGTGSAVVLCVAAMRVKKQ